RSTPPGHHRLCPHAPSLHHRGACSPDRRRIIDVMQPLEADSTEVAPPMVFSLRISLPDLPGMLGRVARAFGKGDVNILTLDVVDRKDGTAVDAVRVDAARGVQHAHRRPADALAGP